MILKFAGGFAGRDERETMHEDEGRSAASCIRIRGARQHNLKNLDVVLPTGRFIAVTGVSGAGKSSLVIETLYAEGQRRYVETFSPYARQFFERLDAPEVDEIEGVLPAIAIEGGTHVRTSRSTVGTLTEIADHAKWLYARAARLFCPGCGEEIVPHTPETVAADLARRFAPAARLAVLYPVPVPERLPAETVRAGLAAQGYSRIVARTPAGEGRWWWWVVQDRFRRETAEERRLAEALEAAFAQGQGRLAVADWDELRARLGEPPETGEPPACERLPAREYRRERYCGGCDLSFSDPSPGLFSFNSPVGACPTCRGFGRVIGIDWDKVIPDPSLSLRRGAIRPWQGGFSAQCQQELEMLAPAAGVPLDVPWCELSEAERRWVLEGDPDWVDWETSWPQHWYGVRRYFEWLESKAYKMHVRVLLSRYRSYTVCPDCHGTRLKPEALAWRLVAPDETPPPGRLPGHSLPELFALPVEEAAAFVHRCAAGIQGKTLRQVLEEIATRLGYLCEVGLGYLTLDRASRTLSGGELQRIHLTTALGTSLVETLFVLEEPTAGLHARDVARLIGAIRRLVDLGNTVVLIEHDPQVIAAADWVIDLGPGAGAQGGQLVAEGPPAAIAAHPASLTGAYLSGRLRVQAERAAREVRDGPWLHLRGAREHNLKGIDLALPLSGLTVIAGVSGSGKSTLVENVLVPSVSRALGREADAPGPYDALEGAQMLADLVWIDQTPLAKSARSMPVTVTGAWDALRRLFAAQPEAAAHGFTAGSFSFNAGEGRCPACGGSGFEHVEMQFLADVYLRCPVCDGRRFRPEVLRVRLAGKNAADWLELTVDEALALLSRLPQGKAAAARLQPLVALGLGYLRLGQPTPTLSGGEAQRLKLAARLAERRGAGKTLYVLDEPTTGLHQHEVARLLRVLEDLTEQGEAVVVVEHHLDVIAAADWVIELGPEGGEGGGRIVHAGPPSMLAAADTATGRALRERTFVFAAPALPLAAEPTPLYGPAPQRGIEIVDAHEHNLKHLDVTIARERLTVVTGVSGSGKSTLAFDIVFAEGQRRYLTALDAYARQFVQPPPPPAVGRILGLSPTVAIEQRTSRGGYKSTVGTLTEIAPFLRLLYARLGTPYCPECGVPLEPLAAASLAQRLATLPSPLSLYAPLVRRRKGIYKELAAWAARRGAATLLVDGEEVPTNPWPKLDRYREHDIDLPIERLASTDAAALQRAVQQALEVGEGVKVRDGLGRWHLFAGAHVCPSCGKGAPPLDPRLFSQHSPLGWCPACLGTGRKLLGEGAALRDGRPQALEAEREVEGRLVTAQPCPECDGSRLNADARAVRLQGMTLPQLARLPLARLGPWFDEAAAQWDERSRRIAAEVLPQIAQRLAFLCEAGLGYLTLERAAPTLSGGEAQRIRLAAQLGSTLRGVCYVLDEPTIGLHPRDDERLIALLRRLQRRGNTVLVVEHDEAMIRSADEVIDLGPGAGEHGGEVVAQGPLPVILASPRSLTGKMLRTPIAHRLAPPRPIADDTPSLWVRGARHHNLQGIDVRLPLARLTVVTGVSGSGKSTLVREVLAQSLRQGRPVGCERLEGGEALTRLLEVDQTPIGKTPRSCPATYLKVFDPIRRLFAETQEARTRGWAPAWFSFNTGEGRCPVCEGQGMITVEMAFLPDVREPCEACGGSRYRAETLQVRWRGASIADVLAMTVAQAAEFFAAHPAIARPLRWMEEVGLGYLRLGQPSPTLSGGEAQRLKLVAELSRPAHTPTLYLLDEPTVGLHLADIEKLLHVLHRLVENGHTVVVIEHDPDVWLEADWIVDLGPGGGEEGGRLVHQGTVESLRRRGSGATSEALKRVLARRKDALLK